MADLVTRMRLDSSEYDQKVKRAAQNLLEFEAQCRATGQSMNTLSKDNLEYVRNLGQMQTASKNVRGRISELSSAFTELSMQYKRLSDEEKKGEIGKALTASIDQLKGRITTLKKDLGDVSKELGDTATSSQGVSSAIDALTSKFGLSIKQLAGWGAAIGAAKAALDVAKDAFFSNEQTLDEWGRTVESAKSVYRGFLDALNTGDISGFLTNIDNIVKAARDAYDAIDELGTFNAFNQRNVAKAQRGLSESMVDYREGKATKDQVRAAGEAYKNELRNRMKLENEAYIEAVNNLAKQRGVKSEDLMKAMSGSYGDYKKLKETPLTGTKTSLQFLGPGQAQSVTTAIPANEMERLGEALRRLNDTELQSLQALGAQADRTGNDIAQVDRQMARLLNGRGVSDGGGGNGGTKGRGGEGRDAALEKETTIQQQIAALEKEALTATDQRREAIHEQILELDEVLRKQKEITESLHAPKDDIGALFPQLDVSDQQGGTPTTPFEKAQNDMRIQIAEQNVEVDQNTFTSLLQVAVQNGLESLSPDFTSFQEKLAEGLDIPDDDWQSLVDKINEKIAAMGGDLKPIKLNVATGEIKEMTTDAANMSKGWQAAARAVSSVGSALQSIDDPAAKIAGMIGQAIANIAIGFATATAKDSKLGVFGWIAAVAGGLSTMIGTIAAIKSATAGSYAEGGIVPGNSFSGDNLTANVNSGELILNRSQQSNLADQLTSGESDGGEAIVRLEGEDLLISINTALRRRGYNFIGGDFS